MDAEMPLLLPSTSISTDELNTLPPPLESLLLQSPGMTWQIHTLDGPAQSTSSSMDAGGEPYGCIDPVHPISLHGEAHGELAAAVACGEDRHGLPLVASASSRIPSHLPTGFRYVVALRSFIPLLIKSIACSLLS